MVYFDLETAIFTPTARKVVADAAKAAAEIKPASVFVIGYTDRSGKDAFNMVLCMRRAEAVAAELGVLGFKAEVKVSGRGEDQSHVATPNGQREYRNRVASIDFQ